MNESLSQPVVEFENSIKPFRETWRSVDVRALCDLRNNLLLSMIACLSPDEPKPLETVDQVQDIVFVRGALPILEIDRLLASLRTGSLILGSYSVGTQEFDRYSFTSLDRPRDEDLSHGWPELHGFSQLSVQAWGNRNLEAIAGSRDLWAAARVQGFSSFPELCLQRLQFDVGSGKVLRVKVFAPVMIRIDGRVEDDQVQFEIRFPSSLPRDSLMLAFRIQDGRGNRLDSGQKKASELQLALNNGWASLGGSVPLPATSARVELRAFSTEYRSGSEVVAAEFLEVPLPVGRENPRWALLDSVIANTRKWTRPASWTKPQDSLTQWLGLSTPRPEPEDFERGVSSLLWLAGCSSAHVGPAEGVDLAIYEAGSRKLAVLISCTTSPDLHGKFNTLLLQANRLREKLQDAEVVAAVFAPVNPEDLTVRTVQEASESNIRLVLLPQLREVCHSVIGRDWETAYDTLMNQLLGS